MSNIQTYLQKILSARYGKDVRQSIHDAIEEVDKVADTAQGSATEAAESAAESARTASEYESNAEQYKNEAKNFRDEAEIFATETVNQIVEEISDHLSDNSNPHNVTAKDIGLENVPNVSTNDQTPTYSKASTRINLVSGEKLSVSMGKIMKWLSDIQSHAFNSPANNLLSTSATTALAAAQGKTLNDKIEAIPKITFSTKEPSTVATNTIVMVYEE